MTSNYECISALDLAWEDYKESPSRKDGISDAMERYHRASGCRFIFDCGEVLKVDNMVKCTACVFFQSFYMRESIHSCDRYQYAAASIYLAAKTNDQPRQLYDVVNVLHTQKNRKRNRKVSNLDKKSSECIHKLNMLKDAELKLSQTLEFEFDIDLPHSIFSLKCLGTRAAPGWLKRKFPENWKEIAKKSVKLLNNSLHSVASLLYPPSFVCCAAIKLAANILNQKQLKYHLQDNWYTVIDNTVNEEIIEYICDEIAAVSDGTLREGYRCPMDYTKLPEADMKEWEAQQKQQQPQQVQRRSVPNAGRKRARFPVDIDGPAPSPLNYPTPSPHSRNLAVTEWTLYVGNLPVGSSEDQLKKVFGSTGLPVKSAKVMKDRGDRPSRYGFVSFLSKSDMETALIDFKNKEIGGVKISIQIAAIEERNPKRRKQNNVKLKGRPQHHPPYGQGPMFHSNQWKSTDVFIGFLPPGVNDEQIKEACSAAFGRVHKVRIHREPNTMKSLGYGFVHFVDPQSKQKALKKGSVQMPGGKSCIIKSTAKDKDEQGPFRVRITPFHDSDKIVWNQSINKQMLARYFMHIGAFAEYEFDHNPASATIEFYQKDAQIKALNLNGQMVAGKNNRSIMIRVEPDQQVKPSGEKSVFVKDVAGNLKSREVFQAFVVFGAIDSVRFSTERDGSKPVKRDANAPKDAIITFLNREIQIKALEAKTITINDQAYEINRYKDRVEIDNEHKVFVLNIPKDLSEVELQKAMTDTFGPIVKSRIQAKSGTGIVRFKSRESADKACRDGRLRVNNYVVYIQPFEKLPIGRTLHVGNLPKVASENEVRAYFESLLPENHGIQQLKIKMPSVNVIFQTQPHAETAFSALRDKVFKGNRLDVEFHQNKTRKNRKQNVHDDVQKTIWIAGIQPNLKDLRRKIEVKCSIMGPVISVQVHKNNKKREDSTWATVTFSHVENAQKAVAQMNGREFLGSTWTVRPYQLDATFWGTKSPAPLGHPNQPISPAPFGHGHFSMNPPPHPNFQMAPPPPLQHFPKGPRPPNFRSPVPRPHSKNGFPDRNGFFN